MHWFRQSQEYISSDLGSHKNISLKVYAWSNYTVVVSLKVQITSIEIYTDKKIRQSIRWSLFMLDIDHWLITLELENDS